MKYYPNYLAGKFYWIVLLILAIVCFRIWALKDTVFALFAAIFLCVVLLVWISTIFIGIKRLEIDGDRLIVVYRTKQISYTAADFQSVIKRGNKAHAYIFMDNGYLRRITPKAYLHSNLLQKEFERMFSA